MFRFEKQEGFSPAKTFISWTICMYRVLAFSCKTMIVLSTHSHYQPMTHDQIFQGKMLHLNFTERPSFSAFSSYIILHYYKLKCWSPFVCIYGWLCVTPQASSNIVPQQHISNSKWQPALCKEQYWHKCLQEKSAHLIIWWLAWTWKPCGFREASLLMFVQLTNLHAWLVDDSENAAIVHHVFCVCLW